MPGKNNDDSISAKRICWRSDTKISQGRLRAHDLPAQIALPQGKRRALLATGTLTIALVWPLHAGIRFSNVHRDGLCRRHLALLSIVP